MAAMSPCRTRCAAFQKQRKSPPKGKPLDHPRKYVVRSTLTCVARHIANNSSNGLCNALIGLSSSCAFLAGRLKATRKIPRPAPEAPWRKRTEVSLRFHDPEFSIGPQRCHLPLVGIRRDPVRNAHRKIQCANRTVFRRSVTACASVSSTLTVVSQSMHPSVMLWP